MPMPAELRTKIRGNQRATGHRGKGEEAPPSTKENQPLRRDSLRFFPAKMVRNVRAGPRRRRSPELAGRQPVGGGMAVARPPTVADGRIHRPWPSPAYVFSPQIWSEPSERALDEGVRRTAAGRRWPDRQPWRTGGFTDRGPRRPTFIPRKYGPNRPSGPSTKEFAGARRTAAGRRWLRPQPWRSRGFTDHASRRLTFFPANMVRIVRKGASPEKFAGPRRTTAGERWPDISSAHGGGGR